MIILKSFPSPFRIIEDNFTATVADLDGQPTSNRVGKWSKLTGTTLGTSSGRINTTTTTNTIYTLDGSYGAFKATLNTDASTGGDAFYFRIQDANNWMRVREYSEQGATTNTSSSFYAGTSTIFYTAPGTCSPFSSSTPPTNFPGVVWEYNPSCSTVTPYQWISVTSDFFVTVTYSITTRFYRTVLEKMTNGTLSQINLGGTSTNSITNSSNTSYVANTSFASLPSRTLVVEATPTTVKVTGYGYSVNISDSSFSDYRTVGIGRGASTLFTTSGLTNFKLEF